MSGLFLLAKRKRAVLTVIASGFTWRLSVIVYYGIYAENDERKADHPEDNIRNGFHTDHLAGILSTWPE